MAVLRYEANIHNVYAKGASVVYNNPSHQYIITYSSLAELELAIITSIMLTGNQIIILGIMVIS